MLNLIRMNLYRFFREKGYIAFIITLLCATLISAIAIEITAESGIEIVESVDENGQKVYNMEVGDENSDIMLSASAKENTSMAELFVETLGSGVIIMISGIFAIIYSDTERRYGFVKNLTVRKKERVAVFAAKAVPVFVFTCYTMVAVLGGIYLGSCFTYPIPFGNVSRFFSYSVVQLFVATAFGIFSLALYELIRKEVVAVIIVIFTSLGLVSKIVQLLEMGLVKVGICTEAFVEKYEITQHLLANRSAMINLNDVSAGKPCALIIAAIGIVIYLAAGMILYRKKDVV